MNRLLPIEGLRAFLALWVVIGHVLFFTVYYDPIQMGQQDLLNHLGKFFRYSPYAVDIFMIVSGFVIFLLLDKKRESYPQFIIRRFFRLYPLYFVLLVISILVGPFEQQVFENSQRYLAPSSVEYYTQLSHDTAQYWWWNLLFHLGMMQGFVPHGWLGWRSSQAFIISAWSIAIEWQFYLVAPIVFWCAMAKKPLVRIVTALALIAFFVVVRRGNPFELFLPMFMPFFCVGIISYWIYKILPAVPADTAFPMTLALSVSIYLFAGKQLDLAPLLLWIPFLGLLCEPAESMSSRSFLWLFNNPAMQFLGAISYGIYLCHELIIMLMQYVLITLFPGQAPVAHGVTLLILTLAGTIAFAALLHYVVEVPGMDLGRILSRRWKAKAAVEGNRS